MSKNKIVVVTWLLICILFTSSCDQQEGSTPGSEEQNIKTPIDSQQTIPPGIPQIQSVDLDELSARPALYVDKNIRTEGFVVKSVGAFMGEAYSLRSRNGIVNASGHGSIALVGEDLDNVAGYLYNGKTFDLVNPRNVSIVGIIRDRGTITDGARYRLEATLISIAGYQKREDAGPPSDESQGAPPVKPRNDSVISIDTPDLITATCAYVGFVCDDTNNSCSMQDWVGSCDPKNISANYPSQYKTLEECNSNCQQD